MTLRRVVGVSVFAALLAACGSPARDAERAQAQAYEAQERVAEERLRLVEQYQDCVDDADGDAAKTSACETYLKAADALR